MLGNKSNVYKSGLNSDLTFKLDYLSEGQYLLMFFQDMNEDNQISSGVLDPFQPSEWFYYYPDTIKIRSNWELELDQITLRKEY